MYVWCSSLSSCLLIRVKAFNSSLDIPAAHYTQYHQTFPAGHPGVDQPVWFNRMAHFPESTFTPTPFQTMPFVPMEGHSMPATYCSARYRSACPDPPRLRRSSTSNDL